MANRHLEVLKGLREIREGSWSDDSLPSLGYAINLIEKVDEEKIEKVLGKIEIPIDTNPMEVKETSNPAVIILKNKYAVIISQNSGEWCECEEPDIYWLDTHWSKCNKCGKTGKPIKPKKEIEELDIEKFKFPQSNTSKMEIIYKLNELIQEINRINQAKTG